MRSQTRNESRLSVGDLAAEYPDSKKIRQLMRDNFLRAESAFFSYDRPVESLVESYIAGVGHLDDWTLHRVRNRLRGRCAAEGLIDTEESLFDSHRRIDSEFLKAVVPARADAYDEPGGAADVASLELFGRFDNPFSGLSIPANITQIGRHKTGPGLLLHSTSNAELFVHPLCSQLYRQNDRVFFPGASNRSLSRIAIDAMTRSARTLSMSEDIVLIQDRFPGDNFSHFLFDWVTRIGHFCASHVADPSGCLFVMGGVVESFQQIVMAAVSRCYGIPKDRFLFPQAGMVLQTRGRVHWFSDSVSAYTHPAQMAHPASIDHLRRVGAYIPKRPTRFRRIYISRADASRRRIQNEKELVEMLADDGFETVVLSDYSIEEQISLVGTAEVIVAPHGMGLTHVSFNQGTAKLLELFHPDRGTDAYALMTRAQGHSYDYVVGTSTPGNFDDYRVPVSALRQTLEKLWESEDPPSAPHETTARTISPPASRAWLIGSQVPDSSDMAPAPANDGGLVFKHTRLHLDTNVGTWYVKGVQPRRLCTASCWIWIPREFDGNSIRLSLGEWEAQRFTGGILECRQEWQQVTASRTSPKNLKACAIVLRVEASRESHVFSTDWRLDMGLVPSPSSR